MVVLHNNRRITAMKKIIGMDLGDKRNVIVVFEPCGDEHPPVSIPNTAQAIREFFSGHAGADVVIEAGTHSAWISRLLQQMGHTVCVGHARKLRIIWDANDKSDHRDARVLGMVYRLEPRLLHPVQHRSEEAQAALAKIKGRDVLVSARTKFVNHVKGILKSLGFRLTGCSPETMPKKAREQVPALFWESVSTVVYCIEQLNEQIRELDRDIKAMCQKAYPEAEALMAVPGVGPITSLTYVLTLEDPARFKHARSVGSFVGLTPKRDQSGDSDKQLRITKAGNPLLRRLLVQAAQYILGPHGPDSALRRAGLRIAERGGKRAKRCAVVAVARKLAVVLHRLWTTGQPYEPFPQGVPA
jgi:transposase